MQPTLCARCKKNVAVVFVQRMENGEAKTEGLCLNCARELGIKPVDDMIQKMGLTDDEVQSLTDEMMSAFGGAEEGVAGQEEDGEDGDEGRTATFPFLNKLFGGSGPTPSAEGEAPRGDEPPAKDAPTRPGKRSRAGGARRPSGNFGRATASL